MPVRDPAASLDQAEGLRTKDHPQFVKLLEQMHRAAWTLTSGEQWHLRYLDAWETMFEGDYTKSEAELHEVINHSADVVLITKASALLLTNLAENQRYVEAFALGNRLTAEVPRIKDPLARYLLLMNLSQTFDLAGQTDLAINYARMMQHDIPAGETPCLSLSVEVAALSYGKRLTSYSPELQRAIDTCVSSQQPVAANSMWLVLAGLYLDEDHPGKAIALLDRIESSIVTNHYYFHALSAQAERAQAYAKLGDDDAAEKAALAAVAMSHKDDINQWLVEAYKVLYQIEKKRGNSTAALSYYEHYVTQNQGYLDDISARTQAYEIAQQNMLMQKLQMETLSKQNDGLRLQQELDKKAVESSRLFIALLLLTLASIMFWLFRLRRSQLRFKRLSCLDGLTGILNHQHFMSEADRALRLLERKNASACLLSIDLDHFKQVNDTHGHAIGDAVLRTTVDICRRQLRPNDLFGRLGGEEFGILLPECSREEGMHIAERIRIAMEAAPVVSDVCVIAFSASIGVAYTGVSGYELQRLCREADAALYKAKRTGRNRVVADSESSSLIEV